MNDKDKKEKETEDLRKQIRELQDQLEELSQKVTERTGEPREAPGERRRRPKPPRFEKDFEEFGRRMGEFGQNLGEYISLVIDDTMRGADRALRSVFLGPYGAKVRIGEKGISVGDTEAPLEPVPPEDAQRLLSPLASAERIKLLYLLAEEPQYHQDLMKESGLAPGTLPHHLKQLEEAGYVTQERVRGRYLITIPGRMALKLAEYLHYQMHTADEKESKSQENQED